MARSAVYPPVAVQGPVLQRAGHRTGQGRHPRRGRHRCDHRPDRTRRGSPGTARHRRGAARVAGGTVPAGGAAGLSVALRVRPVADLPRPDATFLSLAEGELRQRIQEILARSELRFVARIAPASQRVAGLFGTELRPELRVDASLRRWRPWSAPPPAGLILMALSTPDLADERIPARPSARRRPRTGRSRPWASRARPWLPGPDPGISWDDDRIEAVQAAVASLTIPSP